MTYESVWPLGREHGCDITLKGRKSKKHPHRQTNKTVFFFRVGGRADADAYAYYAYLGHVRLFSHYACIDASFQTAEPQG